MTSHTASKLLYRTRAALRRAGVVIADTATANTIIRDISTLQGKPKPTISDFGRVQLIHDWLATREPAPATPTGPTVYTRPEYRPSLEMRMAQERAKADTVRGRSLGIDRV